MEVDPLIVRLRYNQHSWEPYEMNRLGNCEKYTPDVRGGSCTRLFYDFGSHCKPESELEINRVRRHVLQYGLPTTASSVIAPVVVLATPKSANLTHPSLFVKMLAPFMSRWMTPWSCKYTKPSNTCEIYTATKFSGNLPKRLQMLCNDPFSQNLSSC